MSDPIHEDEYDDALVGFLELIYGHGFIAPGGPDEVRNLVEGADLAGKLVLDIGCGIGGVDIMLARDYGCDIIALDIEAPLLDKARERAAMAGLVDRIDFRHVEPGPLPLADAAVDVVFSKDAWIHIPDKPALLADVFRVLRPGGLLLAADWCRGPEPYSADMEYFFKLEGLTYNMVTLDSYGVGLADSGFTDIELRDISDRFRTLSEDQYERLKGPLNGPMRDLVSDKMADHFVENWRQLLVVIDGGELRPGHLRARKPR
ncbi:MAG: methyltransferase domain-containing protein [Alphaproteobacteria bacterium]